MELQGNNVPALLAALKSAKEEFTVIVKREKNEFLSTGRKPVTYAPLADVLEMAEPILLKNNLVVMFGPTYSAVTATSEGEVAGETVGLTVWLCHVDGAVVSHHVQAPFAISKGQTAVQAFGAHVTYLRRTAYKALLNLAEVDDDGSPPQQQRDDERTISDDQAVQLDAALTEGGFDKARFCSYFGIKSLPALPASRFEQAVQAINAQIAKRKGAAK